MSSAATPIPVLLDCDTGIDDAVALIYLAGLHHAGEIILVGVTTTAGNTTALQAAANTRYILDLCGLTDIPVVAGEAAPQSVPLVTTPETHGATGLGYLTAPAVDLPAGTEEFCTLWNYALGKYGEQLRVIITGPATNCAAYLRYLPFGPEFFPHLTLMGGAYLYRGNTTPTAEWNSWVDPHAARDLFAAAIYPVTVCSLEVTEQFLLTPQRLTALVEALGDAAVAAVLPELLRFYFEFHEAQGEGYQAQIHDLISCMIALETIPSDCLAVTVDVECDSPLLRGTTVADYRHHWGRRPNAQLVTAADIPAAHAELLRVAQFVATASGSL